MDIKEQRLKLESTQKAFAELIGYNIRTVQRWEAGQLGMSDLTERKIRNILEKLRC